MNLRFLTGDFRIRPRKLFAVTILSSGTLAWIFVSYYAFEDTFRSLTTDLAWVYAGRALYMSLGAVFAIIGSSISEKVNRKKLLFAWITMGVLTTAMLAVFQGTVFALISSLLMGISLGLGFPCCMAFLAECTVVEERGRVAGIVLLETFAMVVVAVVAYSILGVGLVGLILLCVAVRSSSYIALAIDPCNKEEGKTHSWRVIFSHRDFLLYLVPWLMFNVASGAIFLVWSGLPADYSGAYSIGATLHYLGAGIFGLVGGIAADRFGRKQPIVIGMVMLGISLLLLGVVPSWQSVLIYLTLSGIAWGFLIAVYAAVPGDLAFGGAKEKFYALGAVLPFVIYFALSGVGDFLNIIVPPTVFSSLSSALSIVLFLSVIPVLRAKETLPEGLIRERKLKEHVEKMGELIEESRKSK